MLRLALLTPFALIALSACDGPGTNISIDARGDDNAMITTDNGQIEIKSAGFEGSFKLPKFTINAENFDFNGVKLYPGSTVTNFHISDEGKSDPDKGMVKVDFESPESVATVGQWFRDAMVKQGFKVEADGTGLKGTTDEGDPFTLRLEADGDKKTRGSLEAHG